MDGPDGKAATEVRSKRPAPEAGDASGPGNEAAQPQKQQRRYVAAAARIGLAAASSEDVGCRQKMEDVVAIVPDARAHVSDPLRVAFYAVVDGHGGADVARHVASSLHRHALAAGLVQV